MHFLLLLFVVVFIVVLVSQKRRNLGADAFQSDERSVVSSSNSDIHPSYISKGKLFYKDRSGSVKQIYSKYVEDLKERQERSKQRHGWKENTTLATSFAGMRNGGPEGEESSDIRFVSIVHLDQDKLLYFLQDNNFGGLFSYDRVEDKELRLVHRQKLCYTDLSKLGHDGLVLCSSQDESGSSNIISIDLEGGNPTILTAGDTIDQSPDWADRDEKKIVYQTQGLARDGDGYIVAVGPASINTLVLDSQNVEVVFADNNTDFLKPQVAKSGDLYFIRRPYEASNYGSGNMLIDAVLFPFRLLRAVFHYLNFFSMMYSRKPLTSASGPKVQEDLKSILIKGRRIEAEKALRSARKVNGVPSLVPSSWELIKCDLNGHQTVVEQNVSSFHIDKDDNIIFTNGCGVFVLDKSGQSLLLAQDELIEEISC